MCLRLFWIKKKKIHTYTLSNWRMPVSNNLHFFPPSLSPPSVTVPWSFSLLRASAHACYTECHAWFKSFAATNEIKKKRRWLILSVLGENIECSWMPLMAGHMDRPTQWDVNFPLLQQLSQLNCWAGKWQHWSGEKEEFLNLCLNPSVGVCIVIWKAYGGLSGIQCTRFCDNIHLALLVQGPLCLDEDEKVNWQFFGGKQPDLTISSRRLL